MGPGGIELVTPGSAVQLASVARHIPTALCGPVFKAVEKSYRLYTVLISRPFEETSNILHIYLLVIIHMLVAQISLTVFDRVFIDCL